MKSDVKTLMGIAMLIISGINCVIMAQTETIQYSICTNCNDNNPTMGRNIDYTISQISSDYGMRVAGGGTRFHQAIDYSSVLFGSGDNDKGDAIITPLW